MLRQVFLVFVLSVCASTGGVTLPPDAVGLLAFKSEADLDNKLNYTTKGRFDFCQWQGVKCVEGRVVRYDVNSFGLRGGVVSGSLSRLDQLRSLSLSNNSLAGPIPDFSTLINLKTLFLHHNNFSGTFPPSLLPLRRLLVLDLSHNNFTGLLPQNITLLDRLSYLRLNSNHFYGTIPPLNQTTLNVFNVSNNNLNGPIPVTPTLKKFTVLSFQFNLYLCGEIIHKPCRDSPFFNFSGGGGSVPPAQTPFINNVPPSPKGINGVSLPTKEIHRKHVGLIIGIVTGVLILTAAIMAMFALIRKRREEREEEDEEQEELEPYFANGTTKVEETMDTTIPTVQNTNSPQQNRTVNAKLVCCPGEEEMYTLHQLLAGKAEQLGNGTIGETYKTVLGKQWIVSVKKLNKIKTAITSDEAFEQHMKGLFMLRHPNLVPINAYILDKQKDNKLIIFDYHPGSLYNLIHDSRSSREHLHWTVCLIIAEGVAHGLAYIHHESIFPHGNLKSSNVLLRPDFEACITDYCLTILADTSSDEDPDHAAYKAPEIRNSARKATAESDVYSFGVLLLEILTGKSPSQHPFLAPVDLLHWVRAMRENDSEDDPRLMGLIELSSICSLTSPEQRPTMRQVLQMIQNIEMSILRNGS